MSFMREEIHEQPGILTRLGAAEETKILRLAEAIRSRKIRAVCVAARGTSDNAATYAKYLFEIDNKLPVSLAAPSVATIYGGSPNFAGWLVIGISQSGESTDVVATIEHAKQAGALTAAITNAPGSSLDKGCDFALACNAGLEKSVAATKTYTSTMGLIYLLSRAIAGEENLRDALSPIAEGMRANLALESEINKVAERYRYMSECLVIARGVNQATCQEAALKLAETCYVLAKPYSGADVKHGPIAMVSEGLPVFFFAPSGKAFPSLLDLAREMKRDGAELIAISSEESMLSEARTPLRLAGGVDEMASPFTCIVVAQLFAQALSVTKGFDPDHPRHLSKITRTM